MRNMTVIETKLTVWKSLPAICACLLFTINGFSQTSWSLTGNAGTTNANFIGTTDDKPLIFKVNNQWAGFVYGNNVSLGLNSLNKALSNTGWDNTAIGMQALTNNTTGIRNTAIGSYALDLNTTGQDNVAIGESASGRQNGTVSFNVAIGQKALFQNAKSGNTALGFESGLGNTTGEAFTAAGYKALHSNTTGNNNTAHGFNALFNNTTGHNNTAVGAWSLVANITGDHNTSIGMKSLFSNTTGEYNTAIGVQTLELNTTGKWNVGLGSGALNQNTSGSLNTAGGTSALWNNRTGNDNTAFGQEAMAGNIDGNNNTAVGSRALFSTEMTPSGGLASGHGSNNTAVGFESLRELTKGSYNVGVGIHALRITTTGGNNVATGSYSLTNNTTGSNNIATGAWALGSNTTGKENVAIGENALKNNTTGNGNTAIGYGADVRDNNLTNATAIGYGAKATQSNQIMLGNKDVSSIRSYTHITTISDKRVKKNIKEDVPGLDLIKLLRPVTYQLDHNAIDQFNRTGKFDGNGNDSLKAIKGESVLRSEGENRTFAGFIAQEVDEATRSLGHECYALDVPENGDGLYGLMYEKFTVPLVKAVQELSKLNDEKDVAIALLQKQVESLTKSVNRLLEEHNLTSIARTTPVPEASLEQNYPNPFSQSTTIRYSLPQTFQSAKIMITDLSGNTVRQTPVSGSGSTAIDAGFLTTGIYHYSLFIDNRLIDTKKMIVAR